MKAGVPTVTFDVYTALIDSRSGGTHAFADIDDDLLGTTDVGPLVDPEGPAVLASLVGDRPGQRS